MIAQMVLANFKIKNLTLYAIIKWRINKDTIPLLSDDGLIFRYEIVSSLEQKFFHGVKLKNIWFILKIQNNMELWNHLQQNQKESINILKDIELYDQCALCEKQLNKEDKQFINHYGGEGLCMSFSNEQLEQQGEEIDKAKLINDLTQSTTQSVIANYHNKAKLYFVRNFTYPFGHKVGKIREYSNVCHLVILIEDWILYNCQICDSVQYCNTCGLQ
ncbi:unnamed protein product [Paramecium pentaurelia]|uniref:Uncharacterized protein n=1 Tax=Paramecium pentaurelia TaxID=43138 RepID=A0A8S1XSI1_9CILI|nr:unnamed protein product [Paramecium pentaurelia]